jgi:RND family efflux transporter MFP subunit
VRQTLAGLDAALVAQSEAKATWSRTEAMGANVARATLDTTARALTSAGQEVTRQQALLDQARITLDKYTMRAPFAGTVLALAADPGQSVDTTSVLMTLADMGQLVVETDVDESYATQVKVGQVAALQLTGETEVRPGKVSFVAGQVDTDTGGLAVKIAPDVALAAPIGLTVTVNITVDDRAAALTVPRAALTGDAVMVVEGGQAKRRAVVVIPWPASRLIVTSGLAVGDRVITDPAGLTDGETVTVAP